MRHCYQSSKLKLHTNPSKCRKCSMFTEYPDPFRDHQHFVCRPPCQQRRFK